jgi:hypothetical protein
VFPIQCTCRILPLAAGLDELGQPLANFELARTLGSGRKLSETVIDFARPMLDAEAAQIDEHRRTVLPPSSDGVRRVGTCRFHEAQILSLPRRWAFEVGAASTVVG